MRQDSARGYTGLTGLGVVVLTFSLAGGAAGQAHRAGEQALDPALSPRVVQAPTRGVREPRMVLKPQAVIEGGLNTFFTGDCFYFEDYAGFELGDMLSGISLVTNNNHFTTLGGAPPVGSAPNGAMLDRYIAVARDTLNDAITTAFQIEFNLSTPQSVNLTSGVGSPLQIAQLVYLASDDNQPRTNLWWSPVSFSEGFVVDRVFYGGTGLDGTLGMFSNAQGVLDRIISVGALNDVPFLPTFFRSAEHPDFDPPVNEWFTLFHNHSRTINGGFGRSQWVKSVSSANHSPSFIDPAMASGDITPPDGDPIGWIMTFPGRADDPNTPQVIEGIGIATTAFGEPAFTNGLYGQSSYAPALTFDGIQYGAGLDPVGSPDFEPDDYFFGPLCVNGGVIEQACVIPDFTLTYQDDLESYATGQPIHFQTTRWQGDDQTLITSLQNSTPGGMQSIAYQNLDIDSQFRLAFLTHLPPDIAASIAAPLTVSTQVHANTGAGSEVETSWAIRLFDEYRTESFPATIVLGGIDPTLDASVADGVIYVRQPNPDFDQTQPSDDTQVRPHWIDPQLWDIPPSEPLNLNEILVPTGVSVAIDEFREIRIEIEPQTNNPDERPRLRVFYGEQELFPNGDQAQSWTSGSRTINQLQFWSGHQESGTFDTLFVDDVFFNGAPAFMAPGPNFTSPFLDDFSTYPEADTIDGHGFTWFLDESTVPDIPETQNDPQLTVIPSPAFNPEPGEDVCRYELVEVCLDELDVLPEAGAVIAVRHTTLPPLPNGSTIDCPGGLSSNFAPGVPFTVRTPDANVRIGVGKWSLLNTEPTPYDSNSGDVIGFDYLFGYEPIWRVAVPQEQAVVTTDPVEGANQVLRLINPGAIDTTIGGPTTFASVDALLPAVTAVREMVPTPAVLNELRFDLFIEGVDLDGQPAIVPPRSRLIVPIESADGSRIAALVFGGPSPNFNTTSDLIRFIAENGLEGSTGVSLLSGGEGVSGPLINTWFRAIVRIDHEGTWELLIDEDRDGPLAPVSVETRGPLDADANDPDFSTIRSFRLEQGREIGGDGTPISLPVMVQTKPGGWQAVGPPDADPFNDYCFYSTVQEIFVHPTNPPLIAQPDITLAGLIENVRPLTANQDVIAVLNRRLNTDNTVAGNPLVHDPCPATPTPLNRFRLLDEMGSELVYEGRWRLLDFGPPWPPQANPRPAGGISRPDGTSQTPAVSYNDPTIEPPGYRATLAPRSIILADWAMDADNGVPSALAPLPPSRWYVDNVSLRNVNGPTPCANLAGDPTKVDGADLAQILSLWGPPTPPDNPQHAAADFNGDGVVNGADLATLLANWGPCP